MTTYMAAMLLFSDRTVRHVTARWRAMTQPSYQLHPSPGASTVRITDGVINNLFNDAAWPKQRLIIVLFQLFHYFLFSTADVTLYIAFEWCEQKLSERWAVKEMETVVAYFKVRPPSQYLLRGMGEDHHGNLKITISGFETGTVRIWNKLANLPKNRPSVHSPRMNDKCKISVAWQRIEAGSLKIHLFV